MSSAASPTRPSPWRWWVCGLLLLASTLNYMDRIALNQTAVRLEAALGVGDARYGLLESGFAVAFGVGTLVFGWVVDRGGVRVVYPLAVLGWSVAGFLTGFAPGYWVLFGCRVALGLFEAGNWPCGVRTTRRVMPPAERSLGNSIFQSGTALGAIVTPFIVLGSIAWIGEHDPDAWRAPFRVIGLVGLGWVALWVLTVPRRVLDEPVDGGLAGSDAPFAAVFRDRRFWVLAAVVIGVNSSWHTFRVWLPKFLMKQHGYTELEMGEFMTVYYVLAEAGAWAVGLGTLGLIRLGLPVHASRVATFAACTAVVLSAAAIPFLDRGPTLTAVLLAFGFGAFGLFPTYFTLSQELSARHQGKVTGALGAINALYLAGKFWAEGQAAKELGRYDPFLAAAGVPALVALLLVVAFWREPADVRTRSS